MTGFNGHPVPLANLPAGSDRLLAAAGFKVPGIVMRAPASEALAAVPPDVAEPIAEPEEEEVPEEALATVPAGKDQPAVPPGAPAEEKIVYKRVPLTQYSREELLAALLGTAPSTTLKVRVAGIRLSFQVKNLVIEDAVMRFDYDSSNLDADFVMDTELVIQRDKHQEASYLFSFTLSSSFGAPWRQMFLLRKPD